MRNCEKQVFETGRVKQDELYQVKNNLFCGLVLFTAKVRMHYTPSHTNVSKFFHFQLTFSQLILHLKC